jgi:hypothetical protein
MENAAQEITELSSNLKVYEKEHPQPIYIFKKDDKID